MSLLSGLGSAKKAYIFSRQSLTLVLLEKSSRIKGSYSFGQAKFYNLNISIKKWGKTNYYIFKCKHCNHYANVKSLQFHLCIKTGPIYCIVYSVYVCLEHLFLINYFNQKSYIIHTYLEIKLSSITLIANIFLLIWLRAHWYNRKYSKNISLR